MAAPDPDALEALKLLFGETESQLVVHEPVLQLLFALSDTFVEELTKGACELAVARDSKKVELRDFQMYLAITWPEIRLPGDPIVKVTKRPQGPAFKADLRDAAETAEAVAKQGSRGRGQGKASGRAGAGGTKRTRRSRSP